MVSDRGGRALGASAILDPRSTVRFTGPRRVEITTPVDLVPHNPGGEPWDVGFAPVLMRQRLLPISPDSATFLPEKMEWGSPSGGSGGARIHAGARDMLEANGTSLRLWDEYPPSVEEYARSTARPRD